MMEAKTPLIIGEIVHWVGAPERVAVVISALVGVYHWKHITAYLATLGFITKILGGVGVLLVGAWAGIIPGVDLDVSISTLADLISWAVDTFTSVMEVVT